MKKTYAILAAVLVALIFAGHSYFRLNPFERMIIIDEPSYAARDEDNNLFVIHKNEKCVLRINDKKSMKFEIEGGSRSGKGFYQAKEILPVDNKYIYIVDVVLSKISGRIEAERILRYSYDGKFIDVLYGYEHEQDELKRKVMGLSSIYGYIYFTLIERDGFSVVRLDDYETIAWYPFEEAYVMIANFAVNPLNMEVAFTCLNGEIYETCGDGQSPQRIEIENKHIPRDVKYDANGSLYFTDIGTREIYKLEQESQQTIVAASEVLTENPIYYRLSLFDGGLVTAAEEILIAYEDGSDEYMSEYQLSDITFFLQFFIWVAILAEAFLLILVIKDVWAYFLTRKRSNMAFTLPALFIVIPIISFIILNLTFKNFNERFQRETLQRMGSVSQLMSMIIDTGMLKEIDDPEDFMSDSYREMRGNIIKSFSGETQKNKDLYCVLYKVLDGVIYSCFSLEDDTGAMYPYDWVYEGSTEQWIYENKISVEFPGVSTSDGWWMFVVDPILDSDGNVAALIEVGTDLYTLNEANSELLRDLAIAIAAITVVILLLAVEVLLFINVRKEMSSGNSLSLPVNIVRPIVFLVFFATNICTAFLPLYASRLLDTGPALFGLSRELLIAVPISAEVLFAALFSIAGGVIVNRIGSKNASIAGSLLMFAGLAILAASPNIGVLIIGNSISGAGSGLLLLAVNIFIAGREEDDKNTGFASYSAAMLSGINCGIVIGSTLTMWVSYNTVIYIGAFFMLLCCAFIFTNMKGNTYAGKAEDKEGSQNGSSILAFLRSGRVLTFFLAIFIPYLICSYFLIYSFPVMASDMGMSEANIGYAFLLNGLCVIFLGPPLSKLIQRYVSKEIALVMSVLLYAAGSLLYAFNPTLLPLMVVVVVMGIADSFGFTMQSMYFTSLKETESFGYSKAMGFYSLVEYLAQAFGPIVFSYVLMSGVFSGMLMLYGTLVALAVIFLLFSVFTKRKTKPIKRRLI